MSFLTASDLESAKEVKKRQFFWSGQSMHTMVSAGFRPGFKAGNERVV